jgi:hypothetical protein
LLNVRVFMRNHVHEAVFDIRLHSPNGTKWLKPNHDARGIGHANGLTPSNSDCHGAASLVDVNTAW